MRTNKYEYLFVLQGCYSDGWENLIWEDLTASEDYREVRQNLREYRENEGARYRIIERRVIK